MKIGKHICRKRGGYFFLLLVIIVISCKKTGKSFFQNNRNLPIPKLIDTTLAESKVLELKWKKDGNYNPLYIGKYQSAVKLTHNFFDHLNVDKYLKYSWTNELMWGKMDLEMFIDTSIYTINRDVIWSEDYENLNDKIIKSFPILIKNRSNYNGMIGYGKHIPMILEAKDSLQNWRPIEEPFQYMCGTGLNYIMLPANEIIIAAVPIFRGRYKTELRLKLGNNYSNTIGGSINISQFESFFDKKENN